MSSGRIMLFLVGLWILGMWGLPQGNPPTPVERLESSLRALLDLPEEGSIPLAHTMILQMPDQKDLSVEAELRGDQLIGFNCPRFTLSVNPDTHRMEMIRSDGTKRREVTNADLHSMRWYLSLDPYWVLQRVRKDSVYFQYSEDTLTNEGIYYRRETVPLGQPDEHLYGLYEETLVVDLTTLSVLRYSILTSDIDRVPIMDMVNTYVYSSQRGPTTIQVIQGAQLKSSYPTSYILIYSEP